METVLEEFSNKYDSMIIKRTFYLIVEGIKEGSKIVKIIDSLERNLRESKELKAEINSINTSYQIFLNAIGAIIAPLLAAISLTLVVVLKSIASKIEDTASASVGMDLSTIIENDTLESGFIMYSICSLIILSVFSSMIVSIIKYGNIRDGIKYIPFQTIAAIVSYMFIKEAFVGFFSGMLG